MKYGIREICDVVFRAKAPHKIGKKQFYKDEPVLYFDTLKTSTLEGAVTTVYAQGGKGNSRLVGWDGEKTVTFTMEDALISKESLAILTGAEVVEASSGNPLYQHITFNAETDADGAISLPEGVNFQFTDIFADNNHKIYVFEIDDQGNLISEAYIYTKGTDELEIGTDSTYLTTEGPKSKDVLVDLYIKKEKGVQYNIGTEAIGHNYYIEGSTLFRTPAGEDVPAEFIIPNGKVQTNFTFTMASTGDPSTFTFTVDAFPDSVKGKTEKVFSAIQVLEDNTSTATEATRTNTPAI